VIGSWWSGLGGTAALVAAIAFFAFVIAVAVLVLGPASGILREVSKSIDELRQETVPLLHEVTETVRGVNREMDRVDGLLESAGRLAKNAERIGAVVEQTVSSPLIKVLAFTAGASRAFRRVGKKKKDKD
jgi:uncharacterized protein YoxC